MFNFSNLFYFRSSHVIAIDINPEKIEYAQHNASIYGVNDRIDFVVGDFFQMACRLKVSLPSDSFYMLSHLCFLISVLVTCLFKAFAFNSYGKVLPNL